MKRPYQIDPRPSQDYIFLPSATSQDQILDQLQVMHRMERTRYTRCDYLYQPSSPYHNASAEGTFSSSYCHPVINELTRQNMIDLLYEIGDYCHFRRETVQYAVWNLMDRYLAQSTHKPLERRVDFQLVASTALYIAVKLLEPVSMDVQSLADLSRGLFHAKDVLQMERDMITALQWNISHGPTPIGYVQLYLTLLLEENTDTQLYCHLWEQAQYQVELSLVNYKLVTQRFPSQVGLAAVWNALEVHLESEQAQQWQTQLWKILQAEGLMTAQDQQDLSHIQLQLCKLQFQAEAQMQERENEHQAADETETSNCRSSTETTPPEEDSVPTETDDYDYSDEETERSGEHTPYLFPSPISVAVDLLSASHNSCISDKPKQRRHSEGFFSYVRSFFS